MKMKKSLVTAAIIMAAFVMGFTSCSKDYSKLIVGQWESTNQSWIQNGERTFHYQDKAYTYNFLSNGTGEFTYCDERVEVSNSEKFTYFIQGDSLFINHKDINDNDDVLTLHIISQISKRHMVFHEDGINYAEHVELVRIK